MVKNWADHCSSDEEDFLTDDDLNVVSEDVLKQEFSEPGAPPAAEQQEPPQTDRVPSEQPKPPEEAEAPKRTYEFPTQPPFTAYVGNLAYTIVDPKELEELLTVLAKDVLDLDIKIVDTRIMMERNHNRQQHEPDRKPRHRGFGYVQFETLEMLQGFMALNDTPNAMLAGRKIQVDTSTQRNSNNRQSASFRNRNNNDNNQNNSFRNNNRRSGNFGRNNDGGGESGKAPPQRTRLQLAPRSKPLANEGGEGSGSSSNIFGSGRARDGQSWRSNKAQEDKAPKDKNNESTAPSADNDNKKQGNERRNSHTNNERRNSNRQHNSNNNEQRRNNHRGGRGGRGGGGDTNNKQQQTKAPAPAPKPSPAEPAAAKPPTNKFALLNFDSDSD
mmetsp:Transcript_1945/g.4105  ORF Transcript_1945/g.4105 Transcript_1945/m.4105 type:complete len:386 (+) Transcript_1945:168-1325(+)